LPSPSIAASVLPSVAMLALSSLSSTSFAGPALRATVQAPAPVQMVALDELKGLAKAQNPALGYFDPLNLANLNFWGQGDDATVGFLRQAEIKHGRVAMAAFVGFIVQANGIKLSGYPYDTITATSPCEQWDQLPEAAKAQIILFIGILEVFSEHSYILKDQGQAHYMRGGKPGYFPSLKKGFGVHPVPFDLFDPLNFSKNRSEEDKAKGLLMEVNNGRLAMWGIMGFVAESKVPGSVPMLGAAHLPTYAGEPMAPFAAPIWPVL